MSDSLILCYLGLIVATALWDAVGHLKMQVKGIQPSAVGTISEFFCLEHLIYTLLTMVFA